MNIRRWKRLWDSWDKFWFSADCVQQMRWFRTLFACVMLFAFLVRSLDLGLFYTEKGILRLATVPNFMPGYFRFSLLQIFPSEMALWVFNSLLIGSLVALAMGVYPRFFAALSLMLHVSFVHRNIAVIYGFDSISTYYLFYLCLADSPKTKVTSPLGSLAFRFSQVQLCVIYSYSGMYKLRGTTWWQGDALWGVISNYHIARFDFSGLASFPLFWVISSYLILAWELYFSVLIWTPMRRLMLIVGVMLHVGIGVTLNLPFFALGMMCVYVLFLTSAEMDQIRSLLIGQMRRVRRLFA